MKPPNLFSIKDKYRYDVVYVCAASGDIAAVEHNSIVIISDDDNVENDSDGTEIPDIDNEDYSEISVPLTIILAVIGGYIFVGTLLFGQWEGWDSLTAAYYCFITIATIGFGDVVPSYSQPGQQYILLGTALYMLFGMATLSMCFTLVQDQMASKFRKLREKVGKLLRRLRTSPSDIETVIGDKPRLSSATDNDMSSQVGVVPAAGTEVFETRRRRRAAQLKFRWIRQRFSGKKRGVRHKRMPAGTDANAISTIDTARSSGAFEF